VQVISNAIRIIECVVRNQPLGVTEIAKMLDLPKTTVHRTLQSLEDNNWISRQRQDSRKWVLTPRLWLLANEGPGVEIRDLTLAAQEKLNKVTDENVHITQSEGDTIVVIDKIESSQPIRVYDPLGTKVPLHQSSSGKAMLSTWADDDIESYLDRVEEKALDRTNTLHYDRSRIRAELQQVRECGYAVNTGNWRPEISGIGTSLPLSGKDAPAPYGLAISIPTHRFGDELLPEFTEHLLEARQSVLLAAGIYE